MRYLTNVWKKLKDQKAIDEITIELEEADRFWGLSKKSKLLNIKSKVKVIDKFEDYDKLKEQTDSSCIVILKSQVTIENEKSNESKKEIQDVMRKWYKSFNRYLEGS